MEGAPEKHMRATFEAELPLRLQRAQAVQLQAFIPAHWFASAASECARMYVSGFFYGAISVSQAYVEALTRFLAEHHHVTVGKDVPERCRRLKARSFISEQSLQAALSIFDARNDFHHLNREVEQDYFRLAARAKGCINSLHVLESEVFAFSFSDAQPGTVVLSKPEYWPSSEPGLANIHARHLW